MGLALGISSRAAVITSVLIVGSLLAVSVPASADPVPVVGAVTILAFVGLLFLMNLPINAFWYSVGVLALSRMRRLSFRSAPGFQGRKLSRKVFGAAALVTLVGALIDMASGIIGPSWYREMGVAAALALVLVFASVLAVSFAVLRLRAMPSLMMASGMAIMNLVHWMVISAVFYSYGSSENPTPSLVLYSLVCAVLSLVTYRMVARTGPGPEPSGMDKTKTS